MNDYGNMVQQLMTIALLAADKPQPYLKPLPGGGPQKLTPAQIAKRNAAGRKLRESLKARSGFDLAVPILPEGE